jgi:hypothetical protein
MPLENSETHIADLSELRNAWPGIEISGSPETGAWERQNSHPGGDDTAIARVKDDACGLAPQILTGQGASPF